MLETAFPMPLSGSDVSRLILAEYGRVRPRCARSGAAGAAGPPEIAPESVGAGPVAGRARQLASRGSSIQTFSQKRL